MATAAYIHASRTICYVQYWRLRCELTTHWLCGLGNFSVPSEQGTSVGQILRPCSVSSECPFSGGGKQGVEGTCRFPLLGDVQTPGSWFSLLSKYTLTPERLSQLRSIRLLEVSTTSYLRVQNIRPGGKGQKGLKKRIAFFSSKRCKRLPRWSFLSASRPWSLKDSSNSVACTFWRYPSLSFQLVSLPILPLVSWIPTIIVILFVDEMLE